MNTTRPAERPAQHAERTSHNTERPAQHAERTSRPVERRPPPAERRIRDATERPSDPSGAFVRPLAIERRSRWASLLAALSVAGLLWGLRGLARRVGREIAELARTRSARRGARPRSDGGDAILVVIPAYNEGETIGSVVASLPERVRGYPVEPLVVSDGSEDETAANARAAGAAVVEHRINRGQGDALRTGFAVARRTDAAVVATADGDGQHPTDDLARLVDPIVDDRADFVLGSRYLGADASGNGLVRDVGIRWFTAAINLLTDAGITDCTNGFRAIRGPMLDRLTLTEARFSAPELLIEARTNGLRVEEVPITVEDRKAGETKKPSGGYALGLTRTILVTWLRGPKREHRR